jgi:3-oxoacyl-[acyl-carrier protein] reductase
MSAGKGAVLVTGGGQGIGRAFCRAFADHGRVVVVADLDLRKARDVVTEIQADGRSAVAIGVDVSDAESVTEMARAVAAQVGPVEVLVNNAALFSTLRMGPFTDIDDSEWNRVISVNLTGAFLACRAIVPGMCDRGYGKVINVSSATVFQGRPGYLHYVTSKAGLIGLTRSLASEVGPHGVRVNAITPGSTETEIERATITAAARAAMAEQTALRRVQVPSDLIGAVLFLSGPDSDFITGQTLNVDGGYSFH